MSASDTPAPSSAPDAWTLLRLWTGIGLKSFGGGASTQLLIRRTFVDEHGWVGDAELAHLWNLCQFTPGINLISLTVLIGRKLGGTRGILLSVLGLLLPSAIVTCCLTAGFEALRRQRGAEYTQYDQGEYCIAAVRVRPHSFAISTCAGLKLPTRLPRALPQRRAPASGIR